MAEVVAPKLISQRQFDWLLANYAYFAGCEYIEKRGDHAAMRRWCLQHGLSQSTAEAQALECAQHWYERQLGSQGGSDA